MDNELILNTFGSAFGLADPSPFVMKVMIFLKAHEIDAKYVVGDVRNAPLKKIPFIQHKGQEIPDSELILNYLEAEFNLPKDDLSAEQHSVGHFICRALEERTYWCIVHFRWIDQDSFLVIRDTLLSSVPSFLRGFVGNMVQKSVKKSLHGHGLGRHSQQSIYDFMRDDFKALSVFLGDKPYLFGDQFTRYDCSAAAMLSVFEAEGLPWKAPDVFSEFPNLKEYWERIRDRFSLAVSK